MSVVFAIQIVSCTPFIFDGNENNSFFEGLFEKLLTLRREEILKPNLNLNL